MKKQFLNISFIVAILWVAILPSCYYDVESELYPNGGTTCDTTAAVTFSSVVSPIIVSKCAFSGCHNATSAAAGINLEGYTATKNYITSNQARFFGSINQTSGYSAMPKGGSKLATCDITKIQKWVTAGMPNN